MYVLSALRIIHYNLILNKPHAIYISHLHRHSNNMLVLIGAIVLCHLPQVVGVF